MYRKSWRTKLHSTPDNIRLSNQIRTDMLIVSSKSAYTKLFTSITSPPTSQNSFAKSLQLGNVHGRKIYLLSRQTAIESSLLSFQYKILSNTLNLNEKLFNPNRPRIFSCFPGPGGGFRGPDTKSKS